MNNWTPKSNGYPILAAITGTRTEDLAPWFQPVNSVYCLIIHQFSLAMDFDLWIPVLSSFPAMTSGLNSEVLLSNLTSAAPSLNLSGSVLYLYNSFSDLFWDCLNSAEASLTYAHSVSQICTYGHEELLTVECVMWEIIWVIEVGMNKLTFTLTRLPR